MTLSDNTRGALLMMASMACFTINDTLIKATGGALPLSQILVLRGVGATLALLIMARAFGALRLRLPRRDLWLIATRCVAEVGAAYFFLTALINMPIANVTALLQMLPLTVALGGALFFGEAVGWRRWLAIGVGFGGMLLIVRPGTEGFNAWSVYALIAVAFVTLRDLVTRRMSGAVPSLTITVLTSFAVTMFALLLALGEDWAPLTPRLVFLLGGSTAFVIMAYLFSVMVMRVGEVSFVAPFRYTGLLWALVLGYLAFGEWPAPLTLLGAAIIVATGGFTLWREGQLRWRRRA